MSNLYTRIKKSISFRLKRYFRQLGRKKRVKNNALHLAEIDSLELLEICNETSPISIIYDIGAHEGKWSILAKSIFPKSEIHCFEPIKKHQSILRNNLSNFTNIQIHPVALGNSDGEISINIANHSDSSSIMDITAQQTESYGVFKNDVEPIEIRKLDNYVEENSLPFPDLMKLDIQGYELEALKSAINCMKHGKFIILEVSFLEFYKDQPLFEEVVAFMNSHYYKTVAFGYNTATGIRLEQCDILFENTNK